MTNKIRAKMQAQTVIPPEATMYGRSETVKLVAVYGGSTNAEDNTFATASPSGSLKLVIDNPSAQGFFKPGKKYYIDIVEAPEPAPAT